MPTADEPKVSVRLDFRTHGALLSEAKRRQRKPATLLRMFAQERLGTVEQASGAPDVEAKDDAPSESASPGLAPSTSAEPSPDWVAPKICPIGCPPTRPGKKLCDFCGRLLEEK